jgi:hypothetical protein
VPPSTRSARPKTPQREKGAPVQGALLSDQLRPPLRDDPPDPPDPPDFPEEPPDDPLRLDWSRCDEEFFSDCPSLCESLSIPRAERFELPEPPELFWSRLLEPELFFWSAMIPSSESSQ